MRNVFVIGLVLGLSLGTPALAAPSLFGPTGLIFTPTTESLPMRSYNLHFHATDNLRSYGMNLGITNALEVGLTLLDPDNSSTDTIVNGKYRFSGESLLSPSFTIGVVDALDAIDLSVYGVLGKGFGRVGGSSGAGLRAYVGFGTGLFDENIFAGAELLISKLTIMGEYDGDNVNFGARFGVGQGVQIEAGLLDTEDFEAAISYTAGF
jgi:hypothetical protein